MVVRRDVGCFQGNHTSGWSLRVRGGAHRLDSGGELGDGEMGRVGGSDVGHPSHRIGGDPNESSGRERGVNRESERRERRGWRGERE